MRTRKRVENAFARHARAIFLGREQREATVVGLHDEVGRVLGGIAVVIGKRPPLRDCDARGTGGFKKFIRIPDARECKHATPFEFPHNGRIGRQMTVENRQVALTGLRNHFVCAGALADHQQRVGFREL